MVQGTDNSVELNYLNSLTEYQVAVFAIYHSSASEALRGSATTCELTRSQQGHASGASQRRVLHKKSSDVPRSCRHRDPTVSAATRDRKVCHLMCLTGRRRWALFLHTS